MDDTFRILVVCTGNVCRSPMDEHLLRHGLTQRLGAEAARFAVGSAGTVGDPRRAIEPLAAEALREHGVEVGSFQGQRLSEPLVAKADLVLAAEREHRAAAITLCPEAAGRTFTLRQFARLAEGIDPALLPADDVVARGWALVGAAAGRRGLVAPPAAPADDDVPDPYGADRESFRACVAAIAAALRGPLDLLGDPT
jgi:protein-tyrosine phosphatase